VAAETVVVKAPGKTLCRQDYSSPPSGIFSDTSPISAYKKLAFFEKESKWHVTQDHVVNYLAEKEQISA
jgi:hypothetical protein